MSCVKVFDICCPAGDTFTWHIVWTDSEGEPVDFTGYTITFSVTTDGVTVDYDSPPELTTTPGDGEIDIYIESTVTEEWLAYTTWELRSVSGDDITVTHGRGRIITNG